MIVALLSACAPRPPRRDIAALPDPPRQEEEHAVPPRLPPEIVRDAWSPTHVTIEYGEPYVIKDNNGPLFASIRFPQANGGAADMAIFEWAHGIYQEARDILDELSQYDPLITGEINIHFDSFLVENRYAGVFMRGSFTHSHMAGSWDIVRTFNINISSGELLDNSEIISVDKRDDILELLRARASIEHPGLAAYINGADESWLSHLLISNDGIAVILERHANIPGFMGTLVVALPYNEISFALLLDFPRPTSEISLRFDPTRPIIALTFDDGPGRYTSRLLDLLERYDARATFCVLGMLIHSHTEVLARAVELGNEVIGHSWDHARLTEATEEEIIQQINDTSSAIEDATGMRPSIYRPPYGSFDNEVKRISEELGYAILYWSVDPVDWQDRDADIIYDAVMDAVRDGSIVLAHEIHLSTIEAMERLVPRLIEEGFQLITVSELLLHAHGEILPGVVYRNGYVSARADESAPEQQ